MTTATIYVGFADNSNATRTVVCPTEKEVQEGIVTLPDSGYYGKTFEEFKKKVDSGEIDGWYRAEYEPHTFDLLDLVDVPKDLPDGEPYLFTVKAVYGEYVDYSYVLAYTNDPEKAAHEIAKYERSSENDDWDEDLGGYWFKGNLVKLPTYNKLTQQQAEIWKLAQSFK